MDGNVSKENTLGIPQGGRASPLFFNIIMHEVDLTIIEHLGERVRKENVKRGTTKSKSRSKRDLSLDKKAANARNTMTSAFRGHSSMAGLKQNKTAWEKDLKHRRIETMNKNMKMKGSSVAMAKAQVKISYTRYADDWFWLALTNWDAGETASLKREIGQIIWEKTKLSISDEKTKITHIIKEPAKFLGFEIANRQNMANPKTVLKKNQKYKARPSWGLFFGIDRERVLFRLRQKRMIGDKNQPMANPLMIHLKDHEIVEKYAQIAQGILNYYVRWITFKSQAGHFHYLLRFSCLHTLAGRKRTSISKVTQLFGTRLRVGYSFEKPDGNKVQTGREFPTYQEAMRKAVLISRYQKPDHDFTKIRTNLKTAFKMTKICAVCGTEPTRFNPLQSHHVKHIRKGKLNNFSKEILRRLGKRQIVCCRACHTKIHRGEYDGMKLADLADPELASL